MTGQMEAERMILIAVASLGSAFVFGTLIGGWEKPSISESPEVVLTCDDVQIRKGPYGTIVTVRVDND